MGVFDTLIVTCPTCGKEIHEQYKPGNMDCFYWDKMTGEEAFRWNDTELECHECGQCVVLKVYYSITGKEVKLLPPQHYEWDDPYGDDLDE